MAKVLVKTKETIGEQASYETEYLFEDFNEFLMYEEYKDQKAQETVERIKGNIEEAINMNFEVKKKESVH